MKIRVDVNLELGLQEHEFVTEQPRDVLPALPPGLQLAELRGEPEIAAAGAGADTATRLH